MMNVLYTASDSYLPHLGISLVSLLENNADEPLKVYAVLSEAKKDNLDKLNELKLRYKNLELEIIDGAPYIERMKQLKMIQYRKSFVPNMRLFFTEYIGSDVDRLLYLDCDTVVTGSLKDLFTMDMGQNCAAVELDALAGSYKRCLGYDAEEPYFNAGVLLIDVREWNRCHCSETLFAMLADPQYAHANLDQDYMNQLLHDKIMVLPPQYNLQPHHMILTDKQYFSCYDRRGYYTEAEIRNAVEHPVIIHAYRFLGDFCWHEGNLHPALPYYRKYKALSPWKDLPDSPSSGSTLFRVEKAIYQHFPKGLFFKAWCLMQRRYFVQQDKKIRRTANEIF